MRPPPTTGPGRASAVRQMFDGLATRYDLLNRLITFGLDRYWRAQTVRHAPPVAHGLVIDLCAGTGDLALAYTRRWRCRTIAVDSSESMLRLAHRKMARQRLTRHIQIVRADSLAVPLPSACASVVCMAFGLRNLDDPGAGVAEMVRLAAPDGGRVAILEAHAPPPGILGGLASGYRRVMMPRLARLVAGGHAQAYRYLASSSAAFAPASTIGDLLRKHGLEYVRTRSFAGGIVSLVTGRRA